ncbi:putative nucleotide-binding protein [Algoriphagus iocasae]|uniref:Putative nucleotide-binding protein n=1 Tax=Algoriphagus iocasae TaxID=1836499 RepID=A0A841N400_9BACT|nr:TIR domain-containing protein [Algoriphagus iocasae]MBB6328871.1 putative nucleotide-binding protein [Algoriphagus iocasae]
MTFEEVKESLSKLGYTIKGEKELLHGVQIRLENGGIVNCYNNGNINVQGKNASEIKSGLGLENPIPQFQAKVNNQKAPEEVFVVYGHDTTAKTQLEAMLRRWNVEPIILDQLPSEGKTIIEKLENYTERASFCIVLATPDDEGHRKDHPEEKAYRARQNVVLELGMMLSKLGRDRVAILLRNQDETERPSDIHGLIYIPFKDDIAEVALPLAKEMSTKGYSIDIKRL